jgi:hypothetical protein
VSSTHPAKYWEVLQDSLTWSKDSCVIYSKHSSVTKSGSNQACINLAQYRT